MAERDERPVTLPVWVVVALCENAYGQFMLAEAVTTTHGREELEAAAVVAGALRQLPDG